VILVDPCDILLFRSIFVIYLDCYHDFSDLVSFLTSCRSVSVFSRPVNPRRCFSTFYTHMKSKKTKGKGNSHGGERVGAGRPPNPNKARKISQPSRVLGQPLRWSSRHRPDPNVAPAAFFQPYNTNQPAPLLLDAPTAAAQSQGSGSSAGPSLVSRSQTQ
jgi:hypothetical protein